MLRYLGVFLCLPKRASITFTSVNISWFPRSLQLNRCAYWLNSHTKWPVDYPCFECLLNFWWIIPICKIHEAWGSEGLRVYLYFPTCIQSGGFWLLFHLSSEPHQSSFNSHSHIRCSLFPNTSPASVYKIALSGDHTWGFPNFLESIATRRKRKRIDRGYLYFQLYLHFRYSQ